MVKKNTRLGFALVGVIVAGAILAIITFAFVTFMTNMQRGVTSTRERATRDETFQNLVRLSTSPVGLLQSATLNGTSTQINRCLISTAAADCVHATSSEFDLYDAGGTKVSGTSANPVRYSNEGTICTTAGPTCPLEAITEVTPTCATTANCAQALQLAVTVTLRQSASVTATTGGKMQMAPRNLASTIDVNRVVSSGAQNCATGEVMSGIDAYGKIICTPAGGDPSFGGAWACQLNTSTMGCGGCLSANPQTGGCSCPAGFSTIKVTGCNSTLYRCGFVCAK